MMQKKFIQRQIIVLFIALAFGLSSAVAHAMTYDQVQALGNAAYHQKDTEALAKLHAAAQSGDANAQAGLGIMYNSGLGVPSDEAQSVALINKASEQGNASAQYMRGMLYFMKKDNKQAMQWLRKAAKQDNATAQLFLGLMYYRGYGMEPDNDEAFAWFHKSAKQGNATGQAMLGTMYLVSKDYTQAMSWFRKAAEQGSSEGAAGVIAMYENALGVPRDPMKIMYWVDKLQESKKAPKQIDWLK